MLRRLPDIANVARRSRRSKKSRCGLARGLRLMWADVWPKWRLVRWVVHPSVPKGGWLCVPHSRDLEAVSGLGACAFPRVIHTVFHPSSLGLSLGHNNNIALVPDLVRLPSCPLLCCKNGVFPGRSHEVCPGIHRTNPKTPMDPHPRNIACIPAVAD